MKYVIKISETLQAEVTIEACNKDEAIGKAKQMYENCAVILTADDFEDASFTVKRMDEND